MEDSDVESMNLDQLRALRGQILDRQQAAQQEKPLPNEDQIGSMGLDDLRQLRGQLQDRKLAPYLQEAVDNERKAQASPGVFEKGGYDWLSGATRKDPGIANSYLMRKAASALLDPVQSAALGIAQGRLNRGEESESDLRFIAKMRLQQHLDASRSSGEKVMGGVFAMPGQVGMLMGGARAAGAVGQAGEAAGILSPAAEGGAASMVTRSAIQAAVTPNLGVQNVIEKNVEAGRDPFDIRGWPTGLAKATTEALVLSNAGKLSEKVLPKSIMEFAGGYPAAGATGALVSQPITDLVTHFAGLNTRYGVIQDLLEGKNAEAATGTLLTALNFMAMHSLAHGSDRGIAMANEFGKILDGEAKRGVALESTIKAANDALKILNDAAEQSRATPDAQQPLRSEVVDKFADLPADHPTRLIGELLAKSFPGAAPVAGNPNAVYADFDPKIEGIKPSRVLLTLDPQKQAVNIDFSKPEEAGVPKTIQPGSKELLRGIMNTARAIGEQGVGVTYTASDAARAGESGFAIERAEHYARGLRRLGFELESEKDVSPPGAKEKSTEYVWRPKKKALETAPEMPTEQAPSVGPAQAGVSPGTGSVAERAQPPAEGAAPPEGPPPGATYAGGNVTTQTSGSPKPLSRVEKARQKQANLDAMARLGLGPENVDQLKADYGLTGEQLEALIRSETPPAGKLPEPPESTQAKTGPMGEKLPERPAPVESGPVLTAREQHVVDAYKDGKGLSYEQIGASAEFAAVNGGRNVSRARVKQIADDAQAKLGKQKSLAEERDIDKAKNAEVLASKGQRVNFSKFTPEQAEVATRHYMSETDREFALDEALEKIHAEYAEYRDQNPDGDLTEEQLRDYQLDIAAMASRFGFKERAESHINAANKFAATADKGTAPRETPVRGAAAGSAGPEPGPANEGTAGAAEGVAPTPPAVANRATSEGELKPIGGGQGEAPRPTGFGSPPTAEQRAALISGGQEGAPAGRGGMSTTALANAVVDGERVRNGLPKIFSRMRATFGAVWDAAMHKLDADPGAAERLVGDLRAQPRVVSDLESAMLLHRKVILANEYEKAILSEIDLGNRNIEGSDAYKARGFPSAEEFFQAEKRTADLRHNVDVLDKVLREVGTESGRALAFRRQLVAEDFSLTGLLRRMEAAKGGPLDKAEQARAAEIAQRIQAAQAAADAAQDKLAESKAGYGSNDYKDWISRLADLGRAKQVLTNELVDFKKANRTPAEKLADAILWWRRQAVISSPVTLAKIGAASIARIGIAPAESAAGEILSRLPGLSQIFARARGEGGFSLGVERKAFADGFTEGLKDAWKRVKTGDSDLDVIFGTPMADEPVWREIQGRLHGALKDPAVRNAFTRSLLNGLTQDAVKGTDISRPDVLIRNMADAYVDSQRAKFMQDNAVVDGFNRMVNRWKAAGPAGKVGAFAAEFLVPIKRIPTNVVAEAFQYAFGSVTGGIQAARALSGDINKLPAAEADVIARQLKKGSLGLATLALGYALKGQVGGFFSSEDKRKPGELKPGETQIGNVTVPGYLQHNPLLEVLQMGGSIRRAYDAVHYNKQGFRETRTFGGSAIDGVLGLSENTPFVRETVDIRKAYDSSHERGRVFGELAKSFVEPQFLQWLAGRTDVKEGQPAVVGEKEQRQPKTSLEQFEEGIPGLRQNVRRKVPATR